MLGNLHQGSTYDGTNPLSINTYGFQDFDYGFNLGSTYLIGNNIVNSLRIAANRTNIVKIPDNYKNWAAFGANVSPLAGNVISISTNNSAFTIGGGAASLGEQHNGPMPSVVEDLSWIKGSHQFGFGGAIYQQRLKYLSRGNALGSAPFDGSRTGVVLRDFLPGHPPASPQVP